MISPLIYIIRLLQLHKIALLILFIHPFIKAFFIIFPSFIVKELTNAFTLTDKLFGIEKAIQLIIIYFILVGLNFIYWRIYQYCITIKLFPKIRQDVVIDCVTSLINNSKLFFHNHPASEIAHFLIHLNENIIDLIRLFFDKIAYYLLSFIFIITCLLYYNFQCGCIMTIWIITMVIIMGYAIKKIDTMSTKIILSKAMISKKIVDLFTNISLVQVFCKQNHEITLLDQKTETLKIDEEIANWYYFYICCIYYISFGIMEAVSLYVLINQFKLGIINASDVIFWWTISGSAIVLADSLIDDVLQVPKYYFGIKESLEVLQHNEHKKKHKILIFKTGKIEFKNVTFSFKDKIVLDNVSLIIHPHQKVALVGFSGSGKTTLLFLLLRLYIPQKGIIYIDDQDISEIDEESLYTLFSVTLQDNNIFDRSIIDNIIYSVDNEIIDQEKLNNILSAAQLKEFQNNIMQESKVLSGGQKQRISIARALYKDAPILLFDEPTSSLDQLIEQRIMNTINEAGKTKTIIMITHKLSLAKSFERIIVFDKGKIVQDDIHESLINQEGLYKTLWSLDEIN